MGYFRPQSIDAALQALAERPLTILAGGTDHYPVRVGPNGKGGPDEDILDIGGLDGLRGVGSSGAGYRIGPLTTWTDIVEAPLPPLFDGLKLAAREVGGLQIQNRGTVAGNICNASPAADGVPCLLTMNARVELTSVDGTTVVALQDFITGSRRIDRRPDQLVTGILVPEPEAEVRTDFLKLGARRYLVISIVMVAGLLEVADGRVETARLSVGACSAVAVRLQALEAALVGQAADGALGALAQPEHLADLSPIDDIRGTGSYRGDAALTLLRRCLDRMAGRA